jgi:hypothetical protein
MSYFIFHALNLPFSLFLSSVVKRTGLVGSYSSYLARNLALSLGTFAARYDYKDYLNMMNWDTSLTLLTL